MILILTSIINFNYLNTTTESEFSKRGKNKSSKHHLRQVGLALMVDKASSLPMYFKTYPGNMHDSKLFHTLIDEMFGYLAGFSTHKEKNLTVVFDKGMNSEENMVFFDKKEDILNVPGIQFVDNALIAQETIRSDGHIIKDVERFLQSKPNLAALDILVTCNSGDVTLEGKIASIAEKIMLKGIIRNVSGIKEVFSHLQIEGSKEYYNKSTGMKKK